jgi:transposase InsO family protein
MPIIDICAKLALGWGVSENADTELAVKAWTRTKRTLKKFRGSTKDFILHHDQDPVYTGYQWLRQLAVKSGVKISYTLRGFKDNQEMESFNSRFKNENRSLFLDCETLEELKKTIDKQMIYYNTKRRHSSLDNQAPLIFLKNRLKIKNPG